MLDHERVHHEQSLHRAVDDMAARMTAVAPTDLRARVIDRLPTRRRASGWRGAWALASLATAAVVVVAAASVWPRRESPARVVATNRTPVSATLTGGAPAGAPSAASRRDVPARTRRPPASQPVVPGLPTLARPDALTIGDIQPTGLAIAQLQVAPIVTGRLKMPPVDANGSSK